VLELILLAFAVGIIVGIFLTRYVLLREQVDEINYMENWIEAHYLPLEPRREREED
jgi:uncharacterized protein YneF (UPF0154 family)